MADDTEGLDIVAINAGNIRVVGQTAVLAIRADFAGQHLFAAAHFSRLAGDLETAHAGETLVDPFFREITACVSAAQLTAAAALEAYVNELFIDRPTYFPEYNDPQENLRELWNLLWDEVERKKAILDKYQLALRLKKQPLFTRDVAKPENRAFLSAELLIDVRNALMHFKPQWDHEETKSHRKLTRLLQKEQVSASPFTTGQPLFPTAFMSHDMARWAVKTAWNFIEAFSQRAGLPNKYTYMVNDLNPGYLTWPVP